VGGEFVWHLLVILLETHDFIGYIYVLIISLVNATAI
jgi:hypothetical protein